MYLQITLSFFRPQHILYKRDRFSHRQTVTHDQSGFESQTAFQPKSCLLIKAYCLLNLSMSRSSTAMANSLSKTQPKLFKVSVTEPSDTANAGMAKQTEGRRLALLRKSPPSGSSLDGWLQTKL